MANSSKHLGVEGERLAKSHLIALGHCVLETNWRCGRYEVDLISRHNDTLVITEVKTRSSTNFGDPEQFVSPQKQRFLATAVERYVEEHHLSLPVRFDIIAVLRINNKLTVKHLEDAFYATLR